MPPVHVVNIPLNLLDFEDFDFSYRNSMSPPYKNLPLS